MRGLVILPTAVLALTTVVAAEIGSKRRSGGLGRDINTVIDWRSVRVPGQRESVTSAKENDRIAARDIPAPPLSPTELEEPFNEEDSVGNEIDPIEQVRTTGFKPGPQNKLSLRQGFSKGTLPM